MTRKADSDLIRSVRQLEEKAEAAEKLAASAKEGRYLSALGRTVGGALLDAGWKDQEVSALLGVTKQAVNFMRRKP